MLVSVVFHRDQESSAQVGVLRRVETQVVAGQVSTLLKQIRNRKIGMGMYFLLGSKLQQYWFYYSSMSMKRDNTTPIHNIQMPLQDKQC